MVKLKLRENNSCYNPDDTNACTDKQHDIEQDWDFVKEKLGLDEDLDIDSFTVQAYWDGYSDDDFTVDTISHESEWKVLTDEEANHVTSELLGDGLWAFNAEFLSRMTELPERVFENLSQDFDDSNGTIRELIDKTCGFDKFVEAAIDEDGRGIHISGYDHEEHELTLPTSGKTYFFYRVN